jgi:hypothetical protein
VRHMSTFRRQLRNNAVALISLAVALSGLGYNTWRNERTEHNRNIRTAAFELLSRLADLQRVVYLAQYDRDARGGNPRVGWTYVLVIRDLSSVVPAPVPARAMELQKAWGDDWEGLGRDDEKSVNHIDEAIGGLRTAILGVLGSLH